MPAPNVRRQPLLIQPEVNQRRDGAGHAEGAAGERVVLHRQPADVAAGQAADLCATVGVGGATPNADFGQLPERMRGIGHGRL